MYQDVSKRPPQCEFEAVGTTDAVVAIVGESRDVGIAQETDLQVHSITLRAGYAAVKSFALAT